MQQLSNELFNEAASIGDQILATCPVYSFSRFIRKAHITYQLQVGDKNTPSSDRPTYLGVCACLFQGMCMYARHVLPMSYVCLYVEIYAHTRN